MQIHIRPQFLTLTHFFQKNILNFTITLKNVLLYNANEAKHEKLIDL